MEIINKIVYYNKVIYKVEKITNKYIYVNTLKVDNEINMKCKSLDFYDVFNLKDEIMTHFIDEIENRYKIQKSKFDNYLVIDDIEMVYLHNNILCTNYNDVWATNKQIVRYQKTYFINYYIQLFQHENIKDQYKKWRDTELQIFIFSFIGFNSISNDDDIEILKMLNYYDIYLKLKKEAEMIQLNDKEIVNESCPVCLSCDNNVYKGLYNCSHPICHDCFKKWQKCAGNCPICRANN